MHDDQNYETYVTLQIFVVFFCIKMQIFSLFIRNLTPNLLILSILGILQFSESRMFPHRSG